MGQKQMRIKYFYQQMGTHIGVLIIAFLIVSLLFTQFLERYIYESKIDELTTYGASILNDLATTNKSSRSVLSEYQNVLRSRDIQYSLFDEQSIIIYAADGKTPDITLQDDEWQRLINGQTVVVKKDFTRFDVGMTFVILPYFHNNHFYGGVLLASPISGLSQAITQINKYLFQAVFIALIIALLLSWFLAKFHVKRIDKLKKATSQVAAGDYSLTIPARQIDEFDELAHDFNHMVQQLKTSAEEIESLENRRRQFMADVSHELRTPLTTINGIIEGLRNDMIPESEKGKGLFLASKESKRLIRLVNENLDYEKIRSNQVTLSKKTIMLTEVFHVVKEQLTPLALEKENDITTKVLKDTVIYADYDRLIQILINIVKNSIQFTENGSISLDGFSKENETIIIISDTGIGMEADDIKYIWQRFYKVGPSRTTTQRGEFGLGLSIVKQLVTLHGGHIDVQSERGKGTTFTIGFPKKNEDIL